MNGCNYDENLLATMGIDSFLEKENINNEIYRFKIFDISGVERARKTVYDVCIKISDGFILTFSFDIKSSLDSLNDFINHINDKINIKEKVIIILGNKNDIIEKERKVSTEEGVLFAKSKNFKYFETSAKTGFNIKKVFSELYEDIYNLNVLGKRIISKPNIRNYKNILNKYINV